MVDYLSNTWKEKKHRLILPLIHFLASFLYERTVFIFELDKKVNAIAMSQSYSDRLERAVGYCITKLFGLVFIFLLWRILWFVVDNIRDKYVLGFSIFGLAAGLFSICIHTYLISEFPDNYMTYAYAIRFFPEYWHSAYSSCVYGGFLQVFPHAAAMSFVQSVLATSAIGYLFFRTRNSLSKKGALFTFLLFLVANTGWLFYGYHRCHHYASLCIFFVAMVLLDIVQKKKRPFFEQLIIVLIAALISVWRTEGIVIGAFTIIIAIIFAYGERFIEKLLVLFAYLVALVLVMLPQKLGDAKYYGNDYKFVSSFESLRNILNDPAHDLSYDGVDEDLEVISKIVPISLVAEYGTDGYRRYNSNCGQADINQSLASKEDGASYQKAFANLTLKNLPIYLRTQFSIFTTTIGLTPKAYRAEYTGEPNNYPMWKLPVWDYGKEDVLSSPFSYEIFSSYKAQLILLRYLNVKNALADFCEKIHLKAINLFAVILSLLGIAITELVRLLKKKKHMFFFSLMSASILLQIIAIIVAMPEAFWPYLQPSLYMGVVTIVVFTSSKLHAAEDKKGEE